jgi:hypothetical protein
MAAVVEFHNTWRKSSFSASDANCVEVAFGAWRKSSFSGPDSNCVEVARGAEAVGVRDSKQAGGPVLVFEPGSWSRLIGRLPG